MSRCTWRMPCLPPAVERTCARRAWRPDSDRCREHEYRVNLLPGWLHTWQRERQQCKAALEQRPDDPWWLMRLRAAEHELARAHAPNTEEE